MNEKPAAIVITVLVILIALYVWKGERALADFRVFYTAGERFIAGEPLCQAADGHYQFKYLPVSAIFFAPLALLPLTVAKFIWMLVIVGALAGLVWGSWRLLGKSDDRWPVVIIPTVLVMAKFYVHELELGQANAVFGAIIIFAFLALASDRARLAGALIGAAFLFKPYALIFIPYLVLRRRGWAIAMTLIVILTGLAAPALRYGVEGAIALHKDWLLLVSGSTPALLANPDNVSIFGAMAKWMGTEDLARTMQFVMQGAVVLVLIVLFTVTRELAAPDSDRAAKGHLADIASLLILIPLLSPQGWDYVFLLATPGIMLLISARNMMYRSFWYALIAVFAVIGLSIYDLLGRQLYRAFMDASALTLCFSVVLIYLSWLRFRLARPGAWLDF